MSRHVLVAIDQSSQSWSALEYAFEEFPEATFTVLHVIDPLDYVLEGEVYGSEEPVARAEEDGEDLIDAVDDLAETFDVRATPVLKHGRPARTIVEMADESDIDHVVLGSHGRSGVSRILLGSVAEKVIRRSSVPVTVVR
jgi:nucleotide-binding universal stress UspA family protein